MLRLILFCITLILSIGFIISARGVSQTTDGGADTNTQQMQQPSGGSQSPEKIQGQQETPWYYYWPQENLNPFGMSTLGEDSGKMGSEAGSTLGKSNRRPSNLEVNPPRQRRQTDDAIPPDEEQLITPPEETIGNRFTGEIDSNLSPTEGSGKIYQWFDKNGVLHVTNELRSVPPQFRDEYIADSEENEAEE